jgi:hypothetical protein
MQRSLAYALSPAQGLPLRFLLTAPWFGVLAALAALFAGASLFDSRWSAPALGATHLLTLGYLGMAMAGSILQLIPVVTGAALPVSRAGAALAWSALALGALLLAAALGLNAAFLFVPAALLLACAFATLIAIVARALARAASPAALPMVRGMRLALLGLAVTVTSGVILAFTLGGVLAAPLLLVADLHAAWGLVGWVAMLVVGVAVQVIPMFQASRIYPAPVTRWAPWILAALLVAWSAAWMGGHAGAIVAAALLCLALVAFAAFSAWLLSTRKRKEADVTTLYWRLALASLAASALLYLLPGAPALAVGVVFIVGFAMGVVNGMLYKIVPFLLWYHLQQDPDTKKGEVPAIRLILPDTVARRQFWWHCGALAALLGAVWQPEVLARPACALLGVACLLLGRDLWRAAASFSLRRRAAVRYQ